MKLLITGAGGFIGSHLAEYCCEIGYDVRAFVHYNSNNHWGWLEASRFREQMEVVTGDVRDFDSVHAAMRGCSAVLHLAALIGIPYSMISPLAYVKTNIEGTYNVLHAAKEHSLANVVITSTSETYGSAQFVPINEQHPMVGQSPYSASKIGADQLGISYYRSFDLPVKIVRPFNTYGPRQSARAIIPTIITQIVSGASKIELGSLFPTRDLTFVKDTARGFVEIMQCDSLVGEITNIGMNHEIAISDLAAMIIRTIGKPVTIVGAEHRERPRNSEVDRLVCDNSKLISRTSWRPQFNLESGIAETIQWIEENIHKYKPGIYNV